MKWNRVRRHSDSEVASNFSSVGRRCALGALLLSPGLTLALAVGLVAGLYPALLASRLTPSEALRAQG